MSAHSGEQGSLGGTSSQMRDWDTIQVHTKRPQEETVSHRQTTEEMCLLHSLDRAVTSLSPKATETFWTEG